MYVYHGILEVYKNSEQKLIDLIDSQGDGNGNLLLLTIRDHRPGQEHIVGDLILYHRTTPQNSKMFHVGYSAPRAPDQIVGRIYEAIGKFLMDYDIDGDLLDA